MVLLDSFKNEHDVTFDIGTAAAHRDAIGAVKSAGVQELERVDKEGTEAVSVEARLLLMQATAIALLMRAIAKRSLQGREVQEKMGKSVNETGESG